MIKKRNAFLACLCLLAVLTAGCTNPLRSGPTRMRSEPTISVFYHENGTKRRIKLDEYLVGVVAGEMRPNWPANAYAAQAILARTFTLEFISRGGTRKLHGTDICTDEKHAQAYTTSTITPAIRQAVASTRGQVMFYRNKYVHGWFSASCGGRTAYARQGLAYKGAEPAYIASVSCPESQVIPKAEQSWQATFSPAELAAALRRCSGKDIGTITGVERLAVDPITHRTSTLRLVGSGGTAEVAAADLRVAIDPGKMRSIWLEGVTNTGAGIEMVGRGFGHGVGLCQWGANALAKEGKTPREIVLHYYPRVQITKIW